MTTVKQEVDAVVPVQTAKAHWVSRDTIAWIGAEPNGTYRLYHSPTGQITAQMADGVLAGPFVPLAVDTNGLPRLVVEKFPFLKDATALKISERDWAQIPGLLKGELVLAKMDNAASAEATTLLLAGVLDDLFYFDGELGAQKSGFGYGLRPLGRCGSSSMTPRMMRLTRSIQWWRARSASGKSRWGIRAG
jgi:hypothetical protein